MLLVLNGRWSRFRSITIPVDGIEVDELSPGLFLWFRLREDFFKKVVLLNINFEMPSYCKKQEGDEVIKTVRVLREIKKKILHSLCGRYIYRTDPIFPKFCQLAYSPSPLGDTSNCRPPGRSNGSSSYDWSSGFHR